MKENDDHARILRAKALIRKYGVLIGNQPLTDQQRANALCCYQTKRIV